MSEQIQTILKLTFLSKPFFFCGYHNTSRTVSATFAKRTVSFCIHDLLNGMPLFWVSNYHSEL